MYRLALAVSCFVAGPAWAQGDPRPLLAAEKEAMKPFTWMDGVWRGPAWTILADGKRHEIIQTERIGPFLDGAVKVMEGRGYDPDGRVGFNALGVLSFDPSTRAYSLHSYAMGLAGDFPFTPKADGYVWSIPAGPGATIRYTATLTSGHWREIGERIVEGQPPMQIFEMNLERVGSSDWPAAGAIPLK